MQAFILAGGFATRLWPLTEKRAKPLLPLAGKPLLTHLTENIPEGIPITVSTNAIFAKDFEEWKEARHPERSGAQRHGVEGRRWRHFAQDDVDGAKSKHSNIQILIEDTGHEDEKLGALGAVAKWITEENINEDVLLLAGDNYFGFSIEEFTKRFSGNPLLATHDVRSHEKAKHFGIVLTENSPAVDTGTIRVTGFQEKPAKPQSTLVSAGCYVLPESSLTTLVSYAKDNPDNIGGIFEHFLQEGKDVNCVSFAEPWFDIGSFDAYLDATSALVGENILTSEGSLHRECSFDGSVVLGKDSKIARSKLHNVVLFDDCEVEDCTLENCIVDNNCILRGVDLQGKMLREGTRLIR